MADRESIILMARLASYDKYHAAADRKKAEYFRHDYVYRQNLSSRLFALVGSIIAVLFYFMHRMFVGGLDILDIPTVILDLIKSGIFVVLVQFLYSLIGFVIHSSDYNDAQERIEEYIENMKALSARKASEGSRLFKEDPYGSYEPDDDEYY